jgi:hypothetical protein
MCAAVRRYEGVDTSCTSRAAPVANGVPALALKLREIRHMRRARSETDTEELFREALYESATAW